MDRTKDTPFDPQQYDRLSTGSVPGYAALQELVALAVAAVAPGSSTVLDLGCGTGAGVVALARALPAATLIACDPAAPMVAAARRRAEEAGVKAEFIVGGLPAVASHAPFDAVVCTLVLHFVGPGERVAFLSAIRERLRPGGTLVISVIDRPDDPAVQALWSQIRRHYAVAQGITPAELAARATETQGKVYPLSSEELQAALGSAGFSQATPLSQLVGVSSWLARAPV